MSIKQLAEKLNISLQGTHGDQAKHVSTIEWLLDPTGSEEITDKGRTTLLALGFINAAMENPNFPIVFFDHYAAPYNKGLMQEVLEGMVDRLPVGTYFTLTDYTITYQDKRKTITVYELERRAYPPERWGEVPQCVVDVLGKSLEEASKEAPLSIGHTPETGWFILMSGQGPFIFWIENPGEYQYASDGRRDRWTGN